MALSISRQLEKIEEQIKSKLGDDGLDEVADVVKEEGSRQVEETVYNAYPNPKQYERQYLLQKNWGVSKYTPMMIGIYSDRWDDGRYVSEIVETGEGYMYVSDGAPYPYEMPRPFVQNTIDSLKVSGVHVEAYAKSLEDVGIKTRIK